MVQVMRIQAEPSTSLPWVDRTDSHGRPSWREFTVHRREGHGERELQCSAKNFPYIQQSTGQHLRIKKIHKALESIIPNNLRDNDRSSHRPRNSASACWTNQKNSYSQGIHTVQKRPLQCQWESISSTLDTALVLKTNPKGKSESIKLFP